MGELPFDKYDKVNDNLLMLASKIGIATCLADTMEMDICVGIRDRYYTYLANLLRRDICVGIRDRYHTYLAKHQDMLICMSAPPHQHT